MGPGKVGCFGADFGCHELIQLSSRSLILFPFDLENYSFFFFFLSKKGVTDF